MLMLVAQPQCRKLLVMKRRITIADRSHVYTCRECTKYNDLSEKDANETDWSVTSVRFVKVTSVTNVNLFLGNASKNK
jgi:hypothetical protein